MWVKTCIVTFSLAHDNKINTFSNDTCCLILGGNYNAKPIRNRNRFVNFVSHS